MAGDDSNNNVRDLFEKVFLHNRRQTTESSACYTVLLQHSTSQRLRLRQASNDNNDNTKKKNVVAVDEDVYRRAGVLTPWEAASRDVEAGTLWLQYLTEQLVAASQRHNHPNNSKHETIWLSTVPRRQQQQQREWMHRLVSQKNDMFRVVNSVLQDPWGWEGDDNASGGGGLNSLERITESLLAPSRGTKDTAIKDSEDEGTVVSIVLESMTPLLVRHGFPRTARFLQRLQRQCTVLLVPVLTDQLSRSEHQCLEDMVQSVLCLEQGQAVWIRQGVRERSNLVRQVLAYNIVVAPTSGGKQQHQHRRIELFQPQSGGSSSLDVAKTETIADAGVMQGENDNNNNERDLKPSTLPTTTATKSRDKKIQLSYSEDGRKPPPSSESKDSAGPAAASTPQIFVEEDDPEFDDLDEDDPDDDLDI